MLCIVEIAMSVWGIVTLVKGRISLSKGKEITGTGAYLIGGLLAATLPVIFAIGIVYGIIRGMQGQTDIPIGTIFVDIGVVALIGIGCAILASVYGGENASNPAPIESNDSQPRQRDPNNPYS